MALTVPTTIFPVSERFIGIARETTPGTAVNPGPTIPMTSFQPQDKPVWIMDEAWRASMAGEYDMLQGPIWTETSMAGPVYGDTIGHLLYNILGDYTQSASSTTPTTTSNGVTNPGAGPITVTSGGASFTAGMQAMFFLSGSSGLAEIVTIGTGSTGTSVVIAGTTPLRFSHATGATLTNTTVASGTYANTFSLLNGGNGQPPSHTFTDRTQVPGNANNNAVQYAYGRLSQLTLTGNAQGIFTYAGNLTSYFHAYPSANPVASISSVRATPNWRSTLGLNGTVGAAPVYDITEWEIALQRVVEPIPTNDGSQNPYVIAAGKFTATAKLTFNPAIDESALLYMLNNTQPQLQIIYSNGLSGASNITYTINALLTAFETANITESGTLFGYEVTAKIIANTTNTGASGAYSPLSITVNNAVAVY